MTCFNCLEKTAIVKALSLKNGNLKEAASYLSIRRSELWRLVKLYNIKTTETSLSKYLEPCCENETRNMNGGCDNCGDPCI